MQITTKTFSRKAAQKFKNEKRVSGWNLQILGKQENNYSHNLKVCIALLTLFSYNTKPSFSTLGKRGIRAITYGKETAPISSEEQGSL